MNRRLVLGILAVALLATTAGCSMFTGGISDEELDREQSYDDLRESNATVRIDIEGASLADGGEFRAVYDLNGTDELSMYRSSLYREEALDIYSVRYWYPNGTEVTGSDLDIEQGRSSTDVRVPDGNGTLAMSSHAGSKTFQLPTYVEGSYEVTPPEGHRTSNFLFGNVNPGGFERSVVDDQERLRWDNAETPISVQYYNARDIPLFLGLIGVVGVVGGAGVAYYYRQVKQLERRRKEAGIDLEGGDESDDDPPGRP
ncbi:hypothetical protein HALLA_09315 [Halostagnicola larsenii XH-48]|uniref:Uncharacterized protein n=1 Tax=Halostagnicola larsenii XH-48 TaxID=797299 RepID=W0JJX5_9EURY|nr:DUF5803 family protein [Halostagnicola larsenii]AHF99045.1 hypothetical protein HALLA_09315 [Halostagnicola larsenii XH-48]